MVKKVYGNDCLFRSLIHEWFKRLQEGREALEDDEHSGRPRNVVNEENAEIVREFIEIIADIQGAIQKFEYVSNCALSSGAICLKILPFDCLSLCNVVFFFYDIWM